MGVNIQRHTPDALSPEEYHSVACAEVWVGFQADLNGMEMNKYFATQMDSNPEL